MSAANKFIMEIDRDLKKQENKARDKIVEIGQYLATQLIERSPVDTGRFVGNWNASVAVPDGHTTKSVDPGRSTRLAYLEGKVAEFKYFTGWPLIYFTEALAYASKLENGSSTQAPQGIVAVSIANTEAKFRDIVI